MALTNITAEQLIKLAELKKQSWDAGRELAAAAGVSRTRPANTIAATPLALQTAIEQVVEDLRTTANALVSSPQWADLTPPGKANEWERRRAPHAERLDTIEQTMEQLRDAADQRQQQALEALYPVAQGEQAQQTAEMYVARVLARGRMDYAQLNKIAAEAPSPGRTLVLEEVVARDWFTQDQVNAAAAESNEEYAQVAREVNKIKTDVNAALGMQLQFACERLANVHAAARPAQKYEGMLSVHAEVVEYAPDLEVWEK